MKEKCLKLLRAKYFVPILLALLILLQLIHITDVIVNRKKGYHSDEIFSYALANSFYEPYLDVDSIRGTIGKNHDQYLNHWFSGDVIRNYVTVQKGEQFRYDSVWYNQSMDRHPPFYYSVMHTLCSFFPDTFSYVFGYVINFICFIVTQIFLYKLSRYLLKSKYLALCVCALWGFSTGAIDLTIFIRMYCMLAMWTVIFWYCHVRLTVTDSRPLRKQLIPIVIVTVCGALTQYLFLFLAFVTAVCFCIRYLVRKQWKVFWAYGCSVAGGTAAAMLIFPAYLPNMFSETEHAATNFWWQFRICVRYLLGAVFPVSESILIFWIPTLIAVFMAAIIMAIPLLYLFRDKKPVIAFLGKLKNKASSLKKFRFKKLLTAMAGKFRKIQFPTAVIFLCIITIAALTAYSIAFASMFYIERYIFMLYPLTAVLIACIIGFLLSWSKYHKQITAVILLFVTIVRLPATGLNYLFDEKGDIKSVDAMTTGALCILSACELNEVWMMNYLPAEMYHVDQVFVTYTGAEEECQSELESVASDKPVYLFLQYPEYNADGSYLIKIYNKEKDILEYSSMNEKEYEKIYINFYKNLSIAKEFTYIGDYVMFSRDYALYRLA